MAKGGVGVYSPLCGQEMEDCGKGRGGYSPCDQESG